MTIYIRQGDIVMINHEGDNQKSLRHPLLVIESNNYYFIGLQTTAPKFYKITGKPALDNEFLTKIYQSQKYVECYSDEGFRHTSWALLDKAYKVLFGTNKYQIEKVSYFNDELKLKEIIKRYKVVNNIPLSFSNTFSFTTEDYD